MHATIGDVVLARKDVPASYHVAVVHDDALQGVTTIIRGEDLAFVTPLHRVPRGAEQSQRPVRQEK